ncbi:hypothetical protein JOC86_000716 [Bacillus pakistanensis]|uniref:Uncharacterized protein n=1 Tax=Rossellomorea pakistanensis TaxID=992288 RepID=A0ABS2N8V4_9BACI|nr:hypothetical protein [Bacillus pakistanensis]MBM7584179.1 hypothetical protein [Bacillus pakistanensis]
MEGKLKAVGFPILIVVFFIFALFFHQLQEITKLPNENWSRSIPQEFQTKEKPIIYQSQNEIFLTDKNQVQHYRVSDGLKVQHIGKIPVTIPRGNPFWSNGESFVYLKNDQLILFNKGKETIIDDSVTGISTSENQVSYWKNGELSSLNVKSFESKVLHMFEQKISDVSYGSDGSMIVQHAVNDLQVELYYIDPKGEVSKNSISTLNKSTNDNIGSLSVLTENNQLSIIYSTKKRTQGALSYSLGRIDLDLSKLNHLKASPKEITMLNKETGSKLDSPQSVKVVKEGDESYLLFTAEGQRIGDSNAINVYYGKLVAGFEVKAKPINSTKNVTNFPLKVNKDSILWLNYDGDIYELYGASKDSNVIEESQQLTSLDWKQAGYNTFLMLFSSLITILTSFYWVLPSLLLLIVLYMTKPNIFEKDDINWVEYVSITLFAIMPFTYMEKAMNHYFYSMAPSYFTFSGSSWIILIVITILSAIIWKWGRNPEWGTFGGAFYFMGIYFLIYITSIGPYIFNLY